MKIAAILPARLESTRLPRKLLEKIGDKTILQMTWEKVVATQLFSQVIIGADHQDLVDLAHSFGAQCILTSIDHSTGTDRCAEVAKSLPDHITHVVNVQADEPFITFEALNGVLLGLKQEGTQIATLVQKLTRIEDLKSTSNAKVVLGVDGKVIYFSRGAIPAYRDGLDEKTWLNDNLHWKHIGVYGFQKEVLLEISSLEKVPLEDAEKLEQLRWLYYGYTIVAKEVSYVPNGIDTLSDLEEARKTFRSIQG